MGLPRVARGGLLLLAGLLALLACVQAAGQASAVRPAELSPAELGIRARQAARTQVLAEEDDDEDYGDEDDGEAESGKVNVLLPADCLSVQEIGAVGGFFMVLTWMVLVVASIFMAIKAYQVGPEVQVQKYYYLNAFLCAVASYSYFAMFSGMGWETIEGCRQYFYVRFIELGVSMSITIFSLGLLAGQDTATLLAVMGSGVGSVYALYMGGIALVPLSKFLWFFFALALFAPVVFALLREFRQTVIDLNDPERIELYGRVSLLTIIAWSCYPLVWLLGVGFGGIGVSVEAICYCIVDVWAKVVFSFMIVNTIAYSAEAPGDFQKEYV
ncbi:hypothetical protein T484DRAFT_1928756 [Baffinella frigidus]|nr:hypothetical protein T484DRAFT_1928756 [Cryptophyta sp. CCMP2293]